MRLMEFKMERQGVVNTGDHITVTEGSLPSGFFYYTIDPSLAMSYNIAANERLKVFEGDVTDVVQNARGYYVTVAFDE